MDRGKIRLTRALVNLVWAALCVLCLPPGPAQAQNVASTAGAAKVVVVAPLSLVKSRDLSFGKILPGTAAGTVTVSSATGACTASAALRSHGTCSSAEFNGMGQRNAYVRLQVGSVTPLTGPGAPMTLSSMTVNASPDLGATFFQLLGWPIYQINPANGVFDFRVGGQLQVNANQVPGIYRGTFNVTVDYY